MEPLCFYGDFLLEFWNIILKHWEKELLQDSVFLNHSITMLFLRTVHGMKIDVVSPTQPWAEKIIMSLEWCLLTPLNCIWKRNCTALIYFIISDSILRIEIYYSYYSVFMFLTGVCVSRSPYLCVETYWILCELKIEMYFFLHKCNLLERARL